MAPLPVIANVYRTALKWTGPSGTTAVNVMHFRKSATVAADLFESLDSHVTAAMWEMQSPAVGVDEVDITPLDGTSATSTFLTGRPARWKGNSGAEDVIPASANLIKLQTGFRGRSHRGRVFLPFVGEGNQVNGTLDSGQVADQQAAWTSFINDMFVDDWLFVVASYKLGTAAAVETAQVEPICATQRRRQSRLRI